jgi:hypothetical protein
VFTEGTEEVVLGDGGGPLEVRYVGCGFCLVRRSAFELVARYWGLPRVVAPGGAIVPYYLPMVTAIADRGLAYLGEDYAFCERLRQAGGRIWVDTRLRVGHLGSYEYGFEDVVQPARASSGSGSLVIRPGSV